MTQQDVYQLSNGMMVLGERMDHVESVSFHILTPGGAAHLPKGCCGAGTVLSDWLFRGAGSRNSRQLIDALDSFGIHHNTAVSTNHLTLNAALEAGNLDSAIDIFADILRSPRLEPDQFEMSRQLALQELQGLDDDPRAKVMMLLYEQYYPDPYGRPGQGKEEELEELTAESCVRIAGQLFDPEQMIVSIAGHYDFDTICRQMEARFSGAGKPTVPITEQVLRLTQVRSLSQ